MSRQQLIGELHYSFAHSSSTFNLREALRKALDLIDEMQGELQQRAEPVQAAPDRMARVIELLEEIRDNTHEPL